MSDKSWNNQQCLDLIDLYENNRILWDVKDENYYNRREKEEAWNHLSQVLNTDVDEIKKKMNSLTGSFRRERSKVKRSAAAAKDPREAYKSKWFAFQRMQFLSDKNIDPTLTADTISNEGNYDDEEKSNQQLVEMQVAFMEEDRIDEDEQFQIEYHDSNLLQPSSIPSNFQNKRLRSSPDSYDSKDSYVSYGMYIANELRKYDDHTAACVKHAISNIIFEADMGRFTQEKYLKAQSDDSASAITASDIDHSLTNNEIKREVLE